MHRELGEQTLQAVGDRLSHQMGLSFPENRLSDLERGLVSASVEMDLDGAGECADLILSKDLSRAQIETLAVHLTVGETYFFRDPSSFDLLGGAVLPALVTSAGGRDMTLRVWCAGCSSGEEPYSIAIALHRFLPNIADWRVRILGTDINPVALQKAVRGEFREWSFRSTPEHLRDRYFEPAGDRTWKVVPEIRKMVRFSYLNLVRDSYPSTDTETNLMDLVFCRNVLMYFSAEQTRMVAERLQGAVGPDGWLFVGASEASRSLFPNLGVVSTPQAILFRKSSAPPLAGCSRDDSEMTPYRPRELRSSRAESAAAHQPQRVQAAKGAETSKKEPPKQRYVPETAQIGSEARTPEEESQAAISKAKARWAEGRPSEAERIALEVLQLGENSEALELVARICADDGRLEPGLTWCDRAIAADRLNASLRFLKASIVQELGNATDAVRLFKEVLYLDPSHVMAHYALANQYRRMGRTKDAALHFRNAMTLLSDYPEDELLAGPDGFAAGRLSAIIRSAASADDSNQAGGNQE